MPSLRSTRFCHVAPYSRRLNLQLGVPIYDVYTFVCWFQAALAPRDFGYPGSSLPPVGREP